jgi:hypothetical protein
MSVANEFGCDAPGLGSAMECAREVTTGGGMCERDFDLDDP